MSGATAVGYRADPAASRAGEERPASGLGERWSPRRLGWVCYGLQAAGVFLYIIPIWLEVYLDTRRASQVAVDAFTESHRHWRVRTTLLFLIWTILGGFTLPFGFGWPILAAAFGWYLYRLSRGATRFARGLPVGPIAR